MKIEDLKIIENPVLVRDHALDKLRSAITTGLYPPGTRLVERQLCEAIGVSRTSVREALRQLQSEGLVDVGKRRNIQVALISAKDAEDIYVLREKLETLAARRFAEHADDKQVKQLQRIHKELHRALAKGDLRQLSQIAGQFYEAIIAGADSRIIFEVARQLLARITYLRFRSMSEPGRLQDGALEWDAIMEAILARDPDRAEEAMGAHLRKARDAVVSRLQSEQDIENIAADRRAS